MALSTSDGTQRVHHHELLAHEEARHVEVVDHHVAEEAAGALHVGGGRRGGIAADDGGESRRCRCRRSRMRFSRAAKLGSKRRLKPIIRVDLFFSTIFRQSSMRATDRLTGFSHRMALPAFDAASICSAWKGVGGGDQDRVHVLRLDDVLDARDLGAHLGGQILGRLRHGIGQIGDLRLAGCGDRPGVHLADAACAQDSKTQHSMSPSGCRSIRLRG